MIDHVLKIQIVNLAGNPTRLEFQVPVFRHDLKGIESPPQTTCPVLRDRQSSAQLRGVADVRPKFTASGSLAELLRHLLPIAQFLKANRNRPVQPQQIADGHLPIPQLLHRRVLHRILKTSAFLPSSHEREQRTERRTEPFGATVVNRQPIPGGAKSALPLLIRQHPRARDRRCRFVVAQQRRRVPRCDRPFCQVPANPDPARLLTAPRDRADLVSDVDGRRERPVPQGVRSKDPRRSSVRAEQEMDHLDEAGLARAIARLTIGCPPALVGEDDVQPRAERQGLEGLAVTAH